ncbi:ATP-binding cassette domain-containing protein [Frankia sp. R82]|uniref:ATP-binding cassette domain-containing protein n=1 Tax=Frankia sp. R82 TaxID=2950553 RepID=UPI0020446309|nr:ATP-binding cassette domain-containing protein [Frankia sp. R82]MCM3884069.1 ATP-binding cassette domain-containing protein [Frankia sp. R82]
MSYTVVAEGIRKAFGGQVVLDGVDLALERGSVFGLLGPNGAGKTTLVRILATLVRPDSGRATVAGHDLLTDPVGVKGVISLTGQYAAVDDVLTGRENLEMMAGLLHLGRRAARARAAELLAEFDLTDAQDRRVKTYSGGMRRRLDLAASMIRRPELLFLDEPTTGLDPRSREQLWGTVRHLAAQDVTILLTTQYLEEADQLADTVGMLTAGRIVARGTPEELKSSLGTEIVRLRFPDARAYQAALAALTPSAPASSAFAPALGVPAVSVRTVAGAVVAGSGFTIEAADDGAFSIDIPTDGSSARLRDLLDLLVAAGGSTGAGSPRVSTHRPSLDDVFLALTDTALTDTALTGTAGTTPAPRPATRSEIAR